MKRRAALNCKQMLLQSIWDLEHELLFCIKDDLKYEDKLSRKLAESDSAFLNLLPPQPSSLYCLEEGRV